jgi:ribosomal protein L40E
MATRRTVQTISVLVVLGLFGSIIGSLPGANLVLGPGITAQTVLQLVLALIMVGVLMGGLPAMRLLIAHYIADVGDLSRRSGWIHYRDNYVRLVGNVLYLVALAAIYGVLWPALSAVIGSFPGVAWLNQIVGLAFLLIGLYLLYATYQQIRPLTDLLSSSLVQSGLGGASVAAVVCQACGARSLPGAEFCLRCGAKLEASPKALTCAQCNQPLPAEAAFCPACGAPVATGGNQ